MTSTVALGLRPPPRRLAVVLGLAIGIAGTAGAQPPAPASESPVSLYDLVPGDPAGVGGDAAAEQVRPAAVDRPGGQKRGEFVVAPLPMVTPTFDKGFSAVVGYLYRLDLQDRTTPPSATVLAGFKTSNGSWAAAALQSLHLGHDRFRVLGLAAHTDLNYDFYGIGQSAGSSGISIELNQAGSLGMVEALVRVAPRWYAGARYRLMKTTVAPVGVRRPEDPLVPGLDANLRTASLGPRLEYDSRDNPFYPTGGLQLQAMADLHGRDVGGTRTYQVYQGWLNRYRALGSRQVVAWHVCACDSEGPVPFYDLCLLGRNQDLRGYTTGQYRDRAMAAGQIELRTDLWWRLGAVGFAGVGEVAPDFGSLTWTDLLPGSGLGVRFTLAKRNHVNLRVDYAWGRDSTALYIGVAEAF